MFLPGFLHFFNNYSCMDFRNCFTSFLHSCLGFNLGSKNVFACISTFFQQLFLHGFQQMFNILFAFLHAFHLKFKNVFGLNFNIFNNYSCMEFKKLLENFSCIDFKKLFNNYYCNWISTIVQQLFLDGFRQFSYTIFIHSLMGFV